MAPNPVPITDRPFRDALRDLLEESEWTTTAGNPNLSAFAETLESVHYETLRKVLAGERGLTPRIVEEVSRALRVRPDYFIEYRLWEAQKLFDPREVGFETALANFKAWGEAESQRKGGKRRR